jgi:hypothetical protein
MTLPFWAAFGGLVLLFLIALPIGVVLLRFGEWLLGTRYSLTAIERLVLSFYVTGGLLFLVASLPMPWFTPGTIAGVLGGGFVAYGALSFRERGTGLRAVVRTAASPTGLVLILGSLALLALELSAVWNVLLPNSYDGSMEAIWTNLVVTNHTLPWTLAPYANWGVVYPLSTATWMAVPVSLFGWPAARMPLLLPSLFLALTVPAAYSLGDRFAGASASAKTWTGLVFAGFFGLVASWPRLFVGGSYDFALAMPLLLVLIGWVRPWLDEPNRPWKESVGLGVFVGVLAALNPAAAQFYLLFLIGSVVVLWCHDVPRLLRKLAQTVVIGGVGTLFVLRSVVGFAAWYSYPGHTLQDTGNPPFGTPSLGYSFSAALINGELNPFVPWKAKLSPVPALALELQVLLSVGLVLVAVLVLSRSPSSILPLPKRAVETITIGLIVSFAFTALLVVAALPTSPITEVDWVSSLSEVSIILFIFLSMVALLPLWTAASLLGGFPRPPGSSSESFGTGKRRGRFHSRPEPGRGQAGPFRLAITVGLVLLLSVPLVSGAALTFTAVPGYLHSRTLSTGDATTQDLDALQWAGVNLPTCSRVLVAPASAAQFLPEFARVGLVYPMLPNPVNLTYLRVVDELVNGSYNSSVRSELLLLRVSEVMGTGATYGTYPAFNLTPLLRAPAPDFSVLFSEGDASILEFIPGASEIGCPM